MHLKNFLDLIGWLALAFVIVSAITFTILRSSERYQHCMEGGQQKIQQISPQKQTSIADTFVIGKRCLGDYVQTYAPGITALFTLVLASATMALWGVTWTGLIRQREETRILQRAYLSVEPAGIEWSTKGVLVGQVIFKNVGKLPATEFVSVVKKIEVQDADWVTPDLTDNDLQRGTTGVIPIGAEAPKGSEGITRDEVEEAQASGDRYLYVWGRARFKDGFNSDRHVNFCHRYPLSRKQADTQGPGYSISPKFARYHEHGNKSD